MTDNEFSKQMVRLVNTYGKQAYPDERVKLLRRELGNMTGQEFELVVDQLISENDRPPMMPKIREAIAAVRERSWQREKAIYRADAERFITSLSVEDEKSICQDIRKRIEGTMDDNQWGSFNRMLAGIERRRR